MMMIMMIYFTPAMEAKASVLCAQDTGTHHWPLWTES
jgi:hypothetical protein